MADADDPGALPPPPAPAPAPEPAADAAPIPAPVVEPWAYGWVHVLSFGMATWVTHVFYYILLPFARHVVSCVASFRLFVFRSPFSPRVSRVCMFLRTYSSVFVFLSHVYLGYFVPSMFICQFVVYLLPSWEFLVFVSTLPLCSHFITSFVVILFYPLLYVSSLLFLAPWEFLFSWHFGWLSLHSPLFCFRFSFVWVCLFTRFFTLIVTAYFYVVFCRRNFCGWCGDLGCHKTYFWVAVAIS